MQPEDSSLSTTAGAAVSPAELARLQRFEEARTIKRSEVLKEMQDSLGDGAGDGDSTPIGTELKPYIPAWPDANTTGAFISRAASFRYEVLPTPWYIVARDVIGLYGVFIGIPVAAGVWAAMKVASQVGWT